jgi:hypothetical protein
MAVLANAKHEAFARNLAEGMTADAAYVAAGYRANRGNAATLKANQNILDRVTELQDRAAVGTVTTVETLLEAAWGVIQEARANQDYGAASQTIERAAKIAGLWVDKSKLDANLTAHEDALRELE